MNMLKMYARDDQTDWDEHLSSCLFAYRTSQHSVTGRTPFELVNLRACRMPIDSMFPTVLQSQQAMDMVEKMKETRSYARKEIEKSENRRKILYDEKHNTKESNLKIGDHVYWRKVFNKKGLTGKLAKRWIGPFKIIAKPNEVNFEIIGGNKNKSTVHGNYLKPCTNINLPLMDLQKRGRPRKKVFSNCSQNLDGGVETKKFNHADNQYARSLNDSNLVEQVSSGIKIGEEHQLSNGEISTRV